MDSGLSSGGQRIPAGPQPAGNDRHRGQQHPGEAGHRDLGAQQLGREAQAENRHHEADVGGEE